MTTIMSIQDVLDVVRQKIGQAVVEIGGNSLAYPDDFLIGYVKSTNLELSVFGVITGVEVDSLAVTITPSPSVNIGMLLAYGAAASIVGSDLIDRLRNGELGVSFTSGASSISTNQAGLFLKQSANVLTSLYNSLLTAYLSRDPNAVLGRDDE